MPVIIHEHCIISFFRNITNRFRWVMSSVTCLLIVIVWLVFFYFPLRSHLVQAEQEIFLLSSQTNVLKKTEAQRCTLEHECTIMIDEFAEKEKVMRHYSLDFVLDKASDHGLECVALEPQGTKRHYMLEVSRHKIGFKGSFQSLISYVHELSLKGSCIALRRFEVFRDEDGEVRCSALLKVPRLVGEL